MVRSISSQSQNYVQMPGENAFAPSMSSIREYDVRPVPQRRVASSRGRGLVKRLLTQHGNTSLLADPKRKPYQSVAKRPV